MSLFAKSGVQKYLFANRETVTLSRGGHRPECAQKHANLPTASTGQNLSNPRLKPSMEKVKQRREASTNQIGEKKAEESSNKSDGKQGEGKNDSSEAVRQRRIETMMQRVYSFNFLHRFCVRINSLSRLTHIRQSAKLLKN